MGARDVEQQGDGVVEANGGMASERGVGGGVLPGARAGICTVRVLAAALYAAVNAAGAGAGGDA